MRESRSADFEQQLKKCNGMDDIRKLCDGKVELGKEWMESVRPIIEKLEQRTARVQLKEKNFIVGKPASNENVTNDEAVSISIDKAIVRGKYQQKDMKNCKDFENFLKNHCRLRHYTFQVRKCEDPTCCLPYRNPTGKMNWLPDPVLAQDKEHFKPFIDVYEQETTEKDRPSANVQTVTEVAEILQVYFF